MAMGSFNSPGSQMPTAEINMTPLVDVMLVLLIIFIITIPVINHSVNLELPRASAQPSKAKPETVNLSIDAQGKLFWNNKPLAEADLPAQVAAAAQQDPQPAVHLRAARTTQYEKVAQVMAAAQNGGLTKIGFITEPKP